MQVHFINVGYGEAILIQSAQDAGSAQGAGSAVLIDGGTNREEEYDQPGCIRALDYLKRIGVTSLDLVIVTHIHDDHIGGIPDIIRNLNVSEVWINVKPVVPDLDEIDRFESVINGNLSGVLFRNALRSYAELLRECESRGIPVRQKGSADGFFPLEGDRYLEQPAFDHDRYLELLVPDKAVQSEMLEAFERLAATLGPKPESKPEPSLAPEKIDRGAEALFYEIDKKGNPSSIALRVKAGGTGILLTGDKADGWEEIRSRYGTALESQILKVTHHGQIDGMPQGMLLAARPDIFVICADKGRRFDSAHPALIERVRAFLKTQGKNGGVYVTGDLRAEGTDEKECRSGKEYCAVCFLCDENSGEITTRLIEL